MWRLQGTGHEGTMLAEVTCPWRLKSLQQASLKFFAVRRMWKRGLFELTAGLTTPWPNCNFCGWGGVGWGGDDDILWTWTHGGCYATVLVLSLHTWWMLRNCACLVTAHMVDATQLCLSCNCTHGGCYATVLVLSLHTWWMLRNCACLVIAHMVDATQLCLSCNCTHGGCYATVLVCHCTHGGCYATVLVLSLHTWWMLRNCACLVIAHMVDATQLCLSCIYMFLSYLFLYVLFNIRSSNSCHFRHFGRFCSEWTCGRSCLKHWANWPKKQTMLQDRKKTSFFSAEAFNTHKFHCVFFFEDTNPWKKWDEINIWTNKPYMEFNTLAAFRASSTKCHVNIAQGRNHGRNLVWAQYLFSKYHRRQQ